MFAAPCMNHTNGYISAENSISGRATQRLTCSGMISATDFGASSPRTMCRNVMIANAVIDPAIV
jgi:hypothetical protein